MFYGSRDNAPMSRPEIDRAKTMCASCPVRAVCLEEALANDEDWGIWGGYTRPERLRAAEALGYIDVANAGEMMLADVETIMDAYFEGRMDELVQL